RPQRNQWRKRGEFYNIGVSPDEAGRGLPPPPAVPSFCRNLAREGLGGVLLLRRVGTDDHGVGDREDLVARHADALGMLANRFGIARLVDAESAQFSVGFLDDVAPDPAHAVGHLLVADA